MAPNIATVETSFFDYVVEVAELFMSRYHALLSVEEAVTVKELKQKSSASDVLRHIIYLCKKSSRRLYVMIDEYDNFANTILSISGIADYQQLTHGEGFFRTFFNVIKGGTTGSGAPISRLFVTGVSPITMDDVTSGFNVGKNISIDSTFNSMLGFTQEEVAAMLDYYRVAGQIRHGNDDLLPVMRQWYDHYIFSKKAAARVSNSDMVLYFLDEYFKNYELPEDLVDRNVRVDYGKLRYLITIDRRGSRSINGNFDKLNEIIEKGEIVSHVVKGFPVEKITAAENFLSLLFYFGLLTIKGEEADELVLQIPNETARELYYDIFR